MSDTGIESSERIEELRIVTFKMMGMKLGVDVDRIAGIIRPEEAREREIRVVPCHELLSISAADAAYGAPRVLLLKNGGGADGIMIDDPQDIIPVKAEVVRPLPPLLDAAMEKRVVWGAALIDGEIVLLVDLPGLIPKQRERTP